MGLEVGNLPKVITQQSKNRAANAGGKNSDDQRANLFPRRERSSVASVDTDKVDNTEGDGNDGRDDSRSKEDEERQIVL